MQLTPSSPATYDHRAARRCDNLVFFGIAHTPHAPTWFRQQTASNHADDKAYWQHQPDCPPLRYPERGGDLRQVIKYSDFYTLRQWHNSGIYHDYFRIAGVEHALVLFLPAPGWPPTEATFPFDLSSGWSTAVRVLLVAAIAGSCIALVVQIVTLARWLTGRTAHSGRMRTGH